MRPCSCSSHRFALALIAGVCCSTTLVGQEKTTEQRLEELEQRLEAQDRDLESLLLGSGPGAATGDDSGVSVGGYGEMLYTDRLGSSGDSLDNYRTVIYIGYRFDEEWSFSSELEWEHSDQTAVESAFLRYAPSDELQFRVGNMLVPMGIINPVHEPPTFLSPNRPLVERFILPSTWSENGVAMLAKVGDFDFHLAIMNGFNEDFELASSGMRKGRQGGSNAAVENFAYVARVDFRGIRSLNVGGSVYYGDSGQDPASPSDFNTQMYEVHGQYKEGPLQATGLWSKASVADANLLPTPSASNDLSGWYVEAGWDLYYDNGSDDALIPYLRYASYDLQADSAADSNISRLMFGVSWLPIPRIALKAAYTLEEQAGIQDGILELAAGFMF
jgi:hypothetical protein